MPQNFSVRITYDKNTVLAIIVPQHRKDGMYYEVNIKGFPRFYMHWSPLDRYDVLAQEGLNLPYNLILAVSDVIEKQKD